MQVRFEFRKTALPPRPKAGSASAKPTHDGTVAVALIISKTKYGIYSTGIRTFRAIWDGRKAARVSAESKALINEMSGFQARLEAAYSNFLEQGVGIDAKSILLAAQGNLPETGRTLTTVFDEFIQSRKAMLQPDRRKRHIDQISEKTFDGYLKRWKMIKLYLDQTRQNNLPIAAVNYGFATRLKEFLSTYQYTNKKAYQPATVNKALSQLKMLVTYAQSKGYVQANVISSFACRGGSAANPKPLTEEQLNLLEHYPLSPQLRHLCDSWLIAGELCLHYSDFMRLPSMKFVTHKGKRFIEHERSKQHGCSLKQTVNLTPRAERLLAKYGGPAGLYYKSSGAFASALKVIAYQADLVDANGDYVNLQFGMGRDTGLTSRARQGANGIQLSKMAGWSNPREARRYLGDDLGIVAGFVEQSEYKGIGLASSC